MYKTSYKTKNKMNNNTIVHTCIAINKNREIQWRDTYLDTFTFNFRCNWYTHTHCKFPEEEKNYSI